LAGNEKAAEKYLAQQQEALKKAQKEKFPSQENIAALEKSIETTEWYLKSFGTQQMKIEGEFADKLYAARKAAYEKDLSLLRSELATRKDLLMEAAQGSELLQTNIEVGANDAEIKLLDAEIIKSKEAFNAWAKEVTESGDSIDNHRDKVQEYRNSILQLEASVAKLKNTQKDMRLQAAEQSSNMRGTLAWTNLRGSERQTGLQAYKERIGTEMATLAAEDDANKEIAMWNKKNEEIIAAEKELAVAVSDIDRNAAQDRIAILKDERVKMREQASENLVQYMNLETEHGVVAQAQTKRGEGGSFMGGVFTGVWGKEVSDAKLEKEAAAAYVQAMEDAYMTDTAAYQEALKRKEEAEIEYEKRTFMRYADFVSSLMDIYELMVDNDILEKELELERNKQLHEEKMQMLEEEFETRRQALDDDMERNADAIRGNYNLKKEYERKQKQLEADNVREKAQLEYDNALAQYELEKQMFEMKKKADLSRAAVEGAMAAIVSLASAPFPINIGVAAATAAAVAIEIAKINSAAFTALPPVKPSARKVVAARGIQVREGRHLRGNSHASGGIMIEAEGGEVVINKRSAQRYLPLLSKINEEGGGVPFDTARMPYLHRAMFGGYLPVPRMEAGGGVYSAVGDRISRDVDMRMMGDAFRDAIKDLVIVTRVGDINDAVDRQNAVTASIR
jgi:hypothetical protein